MARKQLLMLLAIATSYFGCIAYAADSDQPSAKVRHESLFRELDSNHDGLLTTDEVPQENVRLFARLKRIGDKNTDGKLSIDEFVAGLEGGPPDGSPRAGGDRPNGIRRGDGDRREGPLADRRREREGRGPAGDAKRADGESTGQRIDAAQGDSPRTNGPRGRATDGEPGRGPEAMRGRMVGPALMRVLDTNADGKLTGSEISDAASALKKLDKNSDGEITRDELGPPQLARELGGGLRGRPEGNSDRAPGDRGQGPSPEAMLNRLKQLDKDGDGKLKKEDLPERMQQRFEQMDANGDGVIDEAELNEIVPRLIRRLGEGSSSKSERADGGQRRRGDRQEGRDRAEK